MMNRGIVERALNSLGKGFDLTSDFRLKYCKGDDRLIILNESETRELTVPGFGSFHHVSIDIKCDKGDRTRYQSDILDFNQMSELLNRRCSIPGKIPNGLFNAMFGFQSGSWAVDATNTKYLGLDGYFITLFNVHVERYPLILSDEVRNAVPSTWDPSALARFIERYGTHIIVGLSMGGQDVVVVRQEKCSNLEASQLKNHLDEVGDQLFSGSCPFFHTQSLKHKKAPPEAFNVFDPQPVLFNNYSSISAKDGIIVICSKRGGDSTLSSHCEWLPTVASMPDAIHFTFIPITSLLLKGVPGNGFLYHAINLYLRYKPPLADLQYFLDFQAHKIWAPVHNDLPLGPTTNIATSIPALQFNLVGPKLYVNTSQVTVGKTPVTGMRLYLEGKKFNRLAIHLQHFSTTPMLLQNKIENWLSWRGSEEQSDHHRYLEPIQWKKFSHICTAPVKYDPNWTPKTDVASSASASASAFIVTGAQLQVLKQDCKNVLHLKLLYSKVSNFCVVQSTWVQSSSGNSHKSNFFSALSMPISGGGEGPAVVMDSSVYPSGPPVPVQTQKLLKVVDLSQLCKGPQDSPGHWLVTGARLELEKGKICLNVKFSLLNMC